MDLIKLIDVAGPKKIKDTLNILIKNYEDFGDRVQNIADKAAEDAAVALIFSNEAKQIAQENTASLEQAIAEQNANIESAVAAQETQLNAAISAQDARITEAVEAQDIKLNDAIAAQDAVVAQSATDATNAKQVAEEALAMIEQADARSEEAALLAEQAEETAGEAMATSELAMNVATEAKSTVDQAVSTGVFGTFVHNADGISLLHAYMTNDIAQEDSEDRFYITTPAAVRESLKDYVSLTEQQTITGTKIFATDIFLNNGKTLKGKLANGQNVNIFNISQSGNATFGDSKIGYVAFYNNIQPSSANIGVISLGSATAAWKDFYLYGNISNTKQSVTVKELYDNIVKTSSLATQVEGLATNVDSVNVGLNVVDNHLTQVQTAVTTEATARADADTVLQNTLNSLSETVSTLTTQSSTQETAIANIINNTTLIADSKGAFKAGQNAAVSASAKNGIAIGTDAYAAGGGYYTPKETGVEHELSGVAIGSYAHSNQLGVAIGPASGPHPDENGSPAYVYRSVSLGMCAQAQANDAIQLGLGVNTQEKSLQVLSDNIYNAKSHYLTVPYPSTYDKEGNLTYQGFTVRMQSSSWRPDYLDNATFTIDCKKSEDTSYRNTLMEMWLNGSGKVKFSGDVYSGDNKLLSSAGGTVTGTLAVNTTDATLPSNIQKKTISSLIYLIDEYNLYPGGSVTETVEGVKANRKTYLTGRIQGIETYSVDVVDVELPATIDLPPYTPDGYTGTYQVTVSVSADNEITITNSGTDGFDGIGLSISDVVIKQGIQQDIVANAVSTTDINATNINATNITVLGNIIVPDITIT